MGRSTRTLGRSWRAKMYTNYLASAEEQEGEGTQPTGNFLTRLALITLGLNLMCS